MKLLFYIFICIAFLFISFFGMGPVLFADGSFNERMLTLFIVLLLYLLLGWIFLRFRKY
ncbi:MAG: DUF6954 family protein [Peptococcales bacterium]|jgi:hypothetical protein